MFCPQCGIEELQVNQFCRACGIDLRRVRLAVAAPDSITASAVSARDEIGRAVAAKIRETRSAEELSVVTEEVLPEIEKFLESPEEKRLRRMRNGTIISGVGIGAAIGVSLMSFFMQEDDLMFLAVLGFVAFFVGLAFILNGVLLTVSRATLPDRTADADSQREIDAAYEMPKKLGTPAAADLFQSVTEHTTRQLQQEKRKNS